MNLWRVSIPFLVFSLGCSDTGASAPGTAKPDPATTTKPTEAAKTPDTNAGSTAAPANEPTSDVTASVSGAPSTTPTADPAKTNDPTAVKTGTPTATATAVASAPDVKGSETTEAAFSAFLSGAGKYKVGSPGTVTAVLNALGEHKVNPDYPIKFTLNAAPAGVTYGETVLRNANKADKKATISIPFTPDSAGSHTISGVFSIGVCVASSCTNQKVPLSVTVKAE